MLGRLLMPRSLSLGISLNGRLPQCFALSSVLLSVCASVLFHSGSFHPITCRMEKLDEFCVTCLLATWLSRAEFALPYAVIKELFSTLLAGYRGIVRGSIKPRGS